MCTCVQVLGSIDRPDHWAYLLESIVTKCVCVCERVLNVKAVCILARGLWPTFVVLTCVLAHTKPT